MTLYRCCGKRLLDLALAGLALILLSPAILGVALGVRLRLGRPILFRQRRPGHRGELFTLLKFRTMRDAVDSAGDPLPDADRLTPFGRFLRRSSLDELPELWNVIRGEMSLVGPRPLLIQYLKRYSPEQSRRHDVLPGITGWAQINGRNALTWERKFELDVWYVDHVSLWTDLRILLRTPVEMLSGRGISHPGHDTAPEFMGTVPTQEDESSG